MFILMFILANTEITGGAIAGGSGVFGLAGWLVKRHLRKRDERNKMLNDKLDLIVNNQHLVAMDLAVAKTKLEAGEARMERIEAACDDLRHDMRAMKRKVTDKLEKNAENT